MRHARAQFQTCALLQTTRAPDIGSEQTRGERSSSCPGTDATAKRARESAIDRRQGTTSGRIEVCGAMGTEGGCGGGSRRWVSRQARLIGESCGAFGEKRGQAGTRRREKMEGRNGR
eukprot:1517001-Rhodomonas_salina.1